MDALRHREREKYTKEYFRQEYWKEDLPEKRGNKGLTYKDPEHLERFCFLGNLLLGNFDFTTLLDAGCGTGLLTKFLCSEGVMAMAFDVAPAAVCDTSSEVLAVAADAAAIPFKDSQFELVFCSDVLEHLIFWDIESAVAELTRVTKRALVLTINVDNPYQFHPTILSTETWKGLFLTTGMLDWNPKCEERLQAAANAYRPEYRFFVFEKHGWRSGCRHGLG